MFPRRVFLNTMRPTWPLELHHIFDSSREEIGSFLMTQARQTLRNVVPRGVCVAFVAQCGKAAGICAATILFRASQAHGLAVYVAATFGNELLVPHCVPNLEQPTRCRRRRPFSAPHPRGAEDTSKMHLRCSHHSCLSAASNALGKAEHMSRLTPPAVAPRRLR